MLISDIPTIYINLEHRKDRNESVLKELSKIKITTPERFNAVEMKNGAIGCSLSHIKCLDIAINRGYEYVMICEDDIEILNPSIFTENINKFLNNSYIEWDVVLIAGNNMIPYNFVTDYCIKVYNCLTTTGYIVKNKYFSTLLNNYKEGVKNLMRDQTNLSFKIDKYWQILQNKDNWYMIIPPTIIQKEDYSDIEKKVTNFRNYMLDFNKAIRK
jgi:GR25 family glycosyltransferase involved in LPS biosynthesis